MEFRNGNLFGATFGVIYACFLFTTPMILRWFAPEITLARVAGAGGFGDSFGAYLLMWAVFTAFFTYGAYYVNLPAFLAFLLLTIVYLLAGIVNITAPTSNTAVEHHRLDRHRRRDLRVVGRIRAGAERHGIAPDHPDAAHRRQQLRGGEMPEVAFSVDQSKSMADQAVPGHNRWHPDIPPAAAGAPGSDFRVECREWTDSQIGNNDSANDVRDVDLTSAHMLSGPIEIEGAQAG